MIQRIAFRKKLSDLNRDLDSDIDFLVELPEKSSLLDLVRLERRLEEILGRKVDLLTYSSIYPSLRPYIQKDPLSIL